MSLDDYMSAVDGLGPLAGEWADKPHRLVYDLVKEARSVRERYDTLLTTVKEAHSQHGDDLCWMPADVNKIFVAAGLPPQDLRVGDTEAMLQN